MRFTFYQNAPTGWSSNENLQNASKQNKTILIVPIAFVSDHSETLVELDIEYKKLAKENGCNKYTRIPALGINDAFIDSLSNLVINKNERPFDGKIFSPKNKCPANFIKCPCQR